MESEIEIMIAKKPGIKEDIDRLCDDIGLPVQADIPSDYARIEEAKKKYGGFDGIAAHIAKELNLPQDPASLAYLSNRVFFYSGDF